MAGDKEGGSVVGQIMVAVLVALLAGGTAPWWWDRIVAHHQTPVPPPVQNPITGQDGTTALPSQEPQLDPLQRQSPKQEEISTSPSKTPGNSPPPPVEPEPLPPVEQSPLAPVVDTPTPPPSPCSTLVGEYRDQGLGVIVPDGTNQFILYNGNPTPQKAVCLSDGNIEVTFQDGYVMTGEQSAEGIAWSNNSFWKKTTPQVRSRSEYENPDAKIF